MLTEIVNARQIPGEPFRRWFSSPDTDLVVWYNDDGAIKGFQFCYDKGTAEKAVTWQDNAPLRHQLVDDGELSPLDYKMSPLLTSDSASDFSNVESRFSSTAADLPADLADFISEKLALNSTP